MTGSSFEHARRGAMTPQRRARIFQLHGGRCYRCTRKIGTGEDWDVEHVVALCNGGSDDDDNLRPCCSWCHDDKTPDDLRLSAKGKRMATKSIVPSRLRRSKWRR